jgi:EAL domain-containing protein (putative c-di-GMP-specific phosphodiesterase class I)
LQLRGGTSRPKAVQELRTYGISLAVDDFGSGYAELSRLKELPVSEVKIDRSYITTAIPII